MKDLRLRAHCTLSVFACKVYLSAARHLRLQLVRRASRKPSDETQIGVPKQTTRVGYLARVRRPARVVRTLWLACPYAATDEHAATTTHGSFLCLRRSRRQAAAATPASTRARHLHGHHGAKLHRVQAGRTA